MFKFIVYQVVALAGLILMFNLIYDFAIVDSLNLISGYVAGILATVLYNGDL